jgi:hypothetical protein
MKLPRPGYALILWLCLAAGAAVAPTAFAAQADSSAAAADTTGSPWWAASLNPEREKQFIEELTVQDVKRFLDPTLMITRVEYQFQANWLPDDIELYTQRLRPWYAINSWSAAWVRLPYLSYSFPDGRSSNGVGDITVGYGVVLQENLRRRMTGLAVAVEVSFPTGDASKGTGFDTEVVALGALLATNPTDLFPVNLIGYYRHSLSGGIEVNQIEATLQTFHLLPRGFFFAFVPSLVVDFSNDFEVFSLGLGVGRALNRRFALQAAYVHQTLGRETFIQAFNLQLQYLWGEDKGRKGVLPGKQEGGS